MTQPLTLAERRARRAERRSRRPAAERGTVLEVMTFEEYEARKRQNNFAKRFRQAQPGGRA